MVISRCIGHEEFLVSTLYKSVVCKFSIRRLHYYYSWGKMATNKIFIEISSSLGKDVIISIL